MIIRVEWSTKTLRFPSKNLSYTYTTYKGVAQFLPGKDWVLTFSGRLLVAFAASTAAKLI